MGEAYHVEGDVIVLHRELTELDKFVKKFLDILTRHSDYLIVSGYVSISTGRTRGTEDVDILVPVLPRDVFEALFHDLVNNGFWCYQGDAVGELYDYVKGKMHIRFAREGEMFPNIELVPVDRTKKVQFFEFAHPQKMLVADFEFKVPPLEFEILYKERVLGSAKDIADALHLRTLFSSILSEEKFKRFEAIVGVGA